jgi:FemAB-related protein (PEP-CTERM system-associated)
VSTASLTVTANALPAADWDSFVQAHPQHTAFHRAGWLRTVHDTLGHRTFALEARTADGQLAGVLPLAQVKSRLFGNFLMSVPFASYGGPLGDAESCAALVERATAIAREAGCSLMELRGRGPLPVALPVSHRKITVVMSMEGGADATFKRFDSKLRSQVRRAERDGVTVHFGHEHLPAYHEVFAQHMRDLGTPAMGADFFDALARAYGDDMVVAVARMGEVPIACAAGFLYGNEFEITWASALLAYKKLSPNMALYWRLMEHVSGRGAGVFNFGRCTEGSNTHKFKKQWGSVDEPLYWYQWHPPTAGAAAATPAPGGAFSLAEQVWRKLPVSLTRRVGPHVARLLP